MAAAAAAAAAAPAAAAAAAAPLSAEAAAALETAFLGAVGAAGGVRDTDEFAAGAGVSRERVVGLMKSLEAEHYVVGTAVTKEAVVVTAEGEAWLAAGSPEARVYAALPEEAAEADFEALGFVKEFAVAAKGRCMKLKWLTRDKASGKYRKVGGASPVDEAVEVLRRIAGGGVVDAKVLKEAEDRGVVRRSKWTAYAVTPGAEYKPVRVKAPADITKEMLESGEWRTAKFRPYNLESAGLAVGGGHEHVLMKVRAEFRQILLEMGFAEMPTNRYVESSFWNFDALFQPQSHPTRDMHDTFFLAGDAAATLTLPEEYAAAVKAVHETGGYGSTGYGYDWKRAEAEKNILRTHTTAVSAPMLYAAAHQPGGFKPVKYFSIDRVFRNEALDATHLAEFHQVEGLIADYDLSLGDLIGTIAEFFRRIGITDLRFKPAFNPYTEPSMEVFGYHPDLKKWTEIGNSGIFRPEMLLPMGLPEGVRVIAWGLSLERPTMIKYRFKNIRDLFGHKVKFDMARAAPIVRF